MIICLRRQVMFQAGGRSIVSVDLQWIEKLGLSDSHPNFRKISEIVTFSMTPRVIFKSRPSKQGGGAPSPTTVVLIPSSAEAFLELNFARPSFVEI